jgi:DNA-binding PadR family transcriptional regulator
MSGKRNSIENKTWWAPVWKGLVMDESATHFQKMGNAVWLFLYFLLNANRSTGLVMRKSRTISLDMGLSRSTIFRWLKTLRDAGYIVTHNSGHSITIQMKKWRPVGAVSTLGQEKSQSWDSRSLKNRTPKIHSEARFAASVKEEPNQALSPKENLLKENNLKSDIAIKNSDFKNSDPMAFKTKEELLAYDLALELDDFAGFSLYLSLARKYPESLLRETLGRVKEIPEGEIKTSRGALFNFLIQKRDIKCSFDPRH